MYKVAQESNSLRAPRISVGIKDKATNYLSWLMFTLKKLIPHVFTSFLFYVGHVYLFLLVVRDHKKSLFGNYHIISKQVYAVSLL